MNGPHAKSCERCGQEFEARRRTARFCSSRCQKAAARRRGSAASRPPAMTRAQVIAELDAVLELMPEDIDVLEARHPRGDDPEVDEVIDGMDVTWRFLEQLRAWFAGKES